MAGEDKGSSRPVVGHVLHSLGLAGAEVLAAAVARRLRGDFEFVFFCLDGEGPLGESLRADGFEVVQLGRRPGVDLALARRLGRAAAERGVALLHAHQFTPWCYSALGRRLGGFKGNILFTEHGRHYPDARRLKRVLFNRAMLRRRDRVTAVGGFVRDALAANEGIAPKRIAVVHNGIAFGPPPTPAQRGDARAKLGLPDDAQVVMQIARFHPVKDHATAIRAMPAVVKNSPLARLVLIGDGDMLAAAKQQAQALRLEQHVHFLGLRQDARELLPAADAFMLSSLSEGISVTFLEAMAASLPIVATDVGGNAEVVVHEQTGLLSPRGDAEKLANNIVMLLCNAEMRKRHGAAGRLRLEQRFTQQQMCDRYAAIYREMLG